MPLKKDEAGRHVAVEVELPGTPEDIWQAMATGAGYSAWFAQTRIEECVGGEIGFDMGGGIVSSGKVRCWEPHRRFGYEEIGWNGDAPPLATELTIEALSGGACKVRMVHSLFTQRDDWDDELESMEMGWPPFFKILRIYLRDFPRQKAAMIGLKGQHAGPIEDCWRAVTQRLRLIDAKPGSHVQALTGEAPDIAGTVEDVQATRVMQAVTLRLDRPGPGIFMLASYAWADTVYVALSLYFYGDQAEEDMARQAPRWDAWLGRHFPALEAAD